MRLLLIEDDEKLAAYVSRGLSEEGLVCDVLADGQDALFHAMREPYDILDVWSRHLLERIDGKAFGL